MSLKHEQLVTRGDIKNGATLVLIPLTLMLLREENTFANMGVLDIEVL